MSDRDDIAYVAFLDGRSLGVFPAVEDVVNAVSDELPGFTLSHVELGVLEHFRMIGDPEQHRILVQETTKNKS